MFLFLCFTAFALSADGFAAGLALGLRGVKIGAPAKIAVALLSAVFAALSVSAGTLLRTLIPDGAESLLGAGILLLMGTVSAVRSLLPEKESNPQPTPRTFQALGMTIQVIRNPAQGDLDHSGTIDLMEAAVLGLSLSVDMLGAGIGLALGSTGLAWKLPVAVGVMQAACLSIGAYVGRILHRRTISRRAAGCLSGVLLMALGAVRIFF